MTAIVTNAKSRMAYNIVRSLYGNGVQVTTSDFIKLSMSFYSRYSYNYFIYPSPFGPDNSKFIDCLIEQIINNKADVLIPVSEETFLISKYQNLISKYTRLALPEYKKILIAHNKDCWEPIARSLNVNVPETFDVTAVREDISSKYRLPYPLLIKPKQGGGGWGILRVDSPDELDSLLQQPMYCNRSWDRFYLQRFIAGDTHCVAMLFNKGELRAKIAYKQIREFPLKNGQATLRISLNSNIAENNFQTLLEQLEWHGVCQADFIIDKESNIPFLIDINPRFWGSIAQSIASGVDFPYLYYKLALNGDVAPVKHFKTGVMTRWIGGELRVFLPLFVESANKLSFLKNFLDPASMRLYKDDFVFKDPIPFFVWLFDAMVRVVKNRSLRSRPHDSLQSIWK